MSEPINYKTRLWRIMGPGPMQPLGDRLGRQNSVCVVRGEGAGRGGGSREGGSREGGSRRHSDRLGEMANKPIVCTIT